MSYPSLREPYIPSPVPVDLWGVDHWSTLLYLETRCVDYDGIPQKDNMRCHRGRHPLYAHIGGAPYPTRLKGGGVLTDHDDWDCVDDMRDAGLVRILGTETKPDWRLTDAGWRMVGELRRHRAKGGPVMDFEPSLPQRERRYVVADRLLFDLKQLWLGEDGRSTRDRHRAASFTSPTTAQLALDRWYATLPVVIHKFYDWYVTTAADADNPFYGEAEIL